jgi:PAS domain S-box-containing protein
MTELSLTDRPARGADRPGLAPPAPKLAFLAGGGAMGALMRSIDWARTPLGAAAAWPQSLCTSISTCLSCAFPILLWWGRELVMLYNDEYAGLLGRKHPAALGQPGAACWPEIWDVIGPMLRQVMEQGEPTRSRDLLLVLERNLFPEECYFSFSYSPIRDESGAVGGVFTPVIETTASVIGTRRLSALRDLAARTQGAPDEAAALSRAADVLAANPRDLPFAAIYRIAPDRRTAALAASAGILPGPPCCPVVVDLARSDPGQPDLAPDLGSLDLAEPDLPADPAKSEPANSDPGRSGPARPGPTLPADPPANPSGAPTPWLEAARQALAGTAGVCGVAADDLAGVLTANPWPDAPHRLIVLPITPPGQEAPVALLVGGLSPRLALDGAYREFLDLVAGQVATALAGAMAYETERRRAAALAELDRAKTAFFANVSHEFRTPLTLLLGPLEELMADRALGAAVRERAELAHRNALRLLRLVDDLLDFARAEAGRAQARFVPTDLAALTAELAAGFAAPCARAGLRLAVTCPPLPAPVPVDRAMWEKIVLNLLSNAFKFTHAGEIRVTLRLAEGAVEAGAEAGAEMGGAACVDAGVADCVDAGVADCVDAGVADCVHAGAAADSGAAGGAGAARSAVELLVEDTGIGIAPQDLDRVFDRFHRVGTARGRSHEGAGIGLALVREAVALHGGAVSVRSLPGRGSMFRVRLPLGRDGVAAATDAPAGPSRATAAYLAAATGWLDDDEPPSQITAAPPRPRVLVADDNADMRAWLRRLLAPDYQVELAADGAAALARALEQPPDLVLADVMMPELDGLHLVARLRAAPRTASVPVIMLSARAGPEAGSEGLRAGADDYLAKPFAAEELRARVAAALRTAALRSAAAARTEFALRAARMVAWDHDLATGLTTRSAEAGPLLGLASGPASAFNALIHPQDRARVLAAREAAIRAGTGFELEYRVVTADGRTLWLCDTAQTQCAPDGTPLRVSGVLADITARKHEQASLREQQERSAFLLALGDRLREAAAPEALMAAAAAALGAHLGVSGVGYAEADATATHVSIAGDWRAPGFPGVSGRHRLDDYAPRLKQELRAGRAVSVEDTEAHLWLDAAGRAAYAASRIRALIEVPLLAEGRLGAALFVLSETPRAWTAGEVALAGEVAERTWAAVRRMRAEAALRASEERLRQLADTVREVFYIADARAGRMEYVSSAYQRVWGLAPDPLYQDHTALLAGVHPDDRAGVRAAMDRQRRAGEATEQRYRVVRPDGSVRQIWDRAWPLRDAAGAVYRIVGVAEDETERSFLLASLAAERSRLRAVFDAAPIGIVVAEAPGGQVIEANRQVAEMFRHPVLPTRDVGAHREWVSFHADGRQVDPADYPLVQVIRGAAERAELEVLYQRGDATRAWVRLAAAPVRDAEGTVVGGVVAALDIDRERRAIAALEAASERQRLLIDELNHRVKNTLAVVQSLALQTIRTAAGLEEFAASFDSRLQGLARAHDLLTREAWEGATLANLAAAALGPWLAEGRVRLEGAAVRLLPKQALALSMAFGELATNAAKYGALSVPGGCVRLECRRDGGEAVLVEWIEHDGPPVQPPSRRGLGTRLLGKPLAAELGGELDLAFAPAGVRCRFRFTPGRAVA